MPSKISKSLTNTKEEQHHRSFQSLLNVRPASDHTIHQSTNLDHANDVTSFFTAEENVKRNIGRGRYMDTRRCAIKNQNQNKKLTEDSFFLSHICLYIFFCLAARINCVVDFFP